MADYKGKLTGAQIDALPAKIAEKYSKPSSGIPIQDLSDGAKMARCVPVLDVTNPDDIRDAVNAVGANMCMMYLVNGTSGGIVEVHIDLARFIHSSEVYYGKKVGAHVGDIVLIGRDSENQLYAKLLTDDEAQEEKDGLFVHGNMTSTEKKNLRLLSDNYNYLLGNVYQTHGEKDCDLALENGFYPWCTENTFLDGEVSLSVSRTANVDSNGYYSITQIAVGRNGNAHHRIAVRLVFSKEDKTEYGEWYEITTKEQLVNFVEGKYEKPSDGIPVTDLEKTAQTAIADVENKINRVSKNCTDAGNKNNIAIGENCHSDGNYSYAQGYGTSSSGTCSHSEGYNTIAENYASHAEGNASKAIGQSSHAEGQGTLAMGQGAHAEGNATEAHGNAAHAEGYGSHTGNDCAHAEGHVAKAEGYASHAEGFSCTATGQGSHAEGMNCNATADGTHAEGYQNKASAASSHVEGSNNSTDGVASHVEGHGNSNKTTGTHSHVEGINNTNVSERAHIEGDSNSITMITDGAYEDYKYKCIANLHVEGLRNRVQESDGECVHIEGCENWVFFENFYGHIEGYANHLHDSKMSHVEGYKCEVSGECNHVEGESCHCYGSTRGHAEGYKTEARGDAPHAEGYYTKAYGNASHAEGYYTKAQKEVTHAEGYMTIADEQGSHTEGYCTNTRGIYSHAEGVSSSAYGEGAHAEGWNTDASGYYCHAEGYGVQVGTFATHAMGCFNKTGKLEQNVFVIDNDAFVIGNGTDDTNRSNAFRVDFIGNTYINGTYNTTGADYAEYFEWEDGNPSAEDRIGKFVTITESGKIKIASEGDDVIGVVSGISSIVGNANEDAWQGMYVTDVYGRRILEEVEVERDTTEFVQELNEDGTPKYEYSKKYVVKEDGTLEEVDDTDNPIPVYKKDEEGHYIFKKEIVTETHIKRNPDYDPTKKYVPRSQRKEWDVIGLLGQVIVEDDGTCIVGKKCSVKDGGIATLGNDWRVIKRLDEAHVVVLASFL